MSDEAKPTRFIFQPEGWEGGFSQAWLYETADLDALQLTDDEYEVLFIQPVCAVFPEVLKIGEWKLILDREIDNEMFRKWLLGSDRRLKEIGKEWKKGKLEDGTEIYYLGNTKDSLEGVVKIVRI